VNQTIGPGFTLIANPFKNATNTLNALLDPNLMGPSLGAGVTVYRFTPSGYFVSTVDSLGGQFWLGPDGNLNGDTESIIFGDGVFIYNPNPAFTVTWVGEVEQGSPIQNPVPPGFSIKSSKVPQAGKIQSELGFPGAPSDTVYKWSTAQQKYVVFTQDSLGGGTAGDWLDEAGNQVEPSLAIAESMFFSNPGALRSWNRNFTVN
jgi:hypothetical protein